MLATITISINRVIALYITYTWNIFMDFLFNVEFNIYKTHATYMQVIKQSMVFCYGGLS